MKSKFTLFVLAVLNITIAIGQNDTIYLQRSFEDLFNNRSQKLKLFNGSSDVEISNLVFNQSHEIMALTGNDENQSTYLSIKRQHGIANGFLINYDQGRAYHFHEFKNEAFFVETSYENVLPNEKDLLAHDHETRDYVLHEEQKLPIGNNLTAAGLNLQSRPGATTSILLDFDGEDISGWGYRFPEVYDSEYTPDQIRKVWEVIAADFIMFDVNITTDESIFNSYDVTHKMKLVIGHCTGLNKVGGLSLVNIFGTGSGSLVNSKNSSEDLIAVAHIGSHEIGHGLGLFHDGTMWPGPSIPYYDGHADWAPIMGTSYGKKFVTWSLGEYEFASQAQDDLEIIGSHLGFAEDDKNGVQFLVNGKGDTLNRADNFGIIENRNDVDTFLFELTEEGPVKLNVGTSVEHTNLDVLVTLTDESGVIIDTQNPIGERSCSIDKTLLPGIYHLIISSGSENGPNDGFTTYSSFGYYDINGSIPTAKQPGYDLSISSVSGFSSLCGEVISGEVIVKNMGENPIEGGSLLVFVDGILSNSLTLTSTLASKETYQFLNIDIDQLGAHNLKFEIVAPVGVDETLLSNNSYQTSYNLSAGTNVQFRTNLMSYDGESPFTWEVNKAAVVNNSFSVELAISDDIITQDFCLVEDCYEFVMAGDYNQCSAYPDHVNGQVYNAKDRVNYEGAIYECKWWNSNLPTSSAWSKIKDCNEGSYYAELYNSEADSILLRVHDELANDEFCMITLLTSTKDEFNQQGGIVVWPNPSAGRFVIESGEVISDLVIYDFKGAIINKYSPNTIRHNFDLTSLPSGVYFLQVNNQFTTKIVLLNK